jgi:hypothetical protein
MENGGLLSERAPVVGVIEGTDSKCADSRRDDFLIRGESKDFEKPYSTKKDRDAQPNLPAPDFGGHVWEAHGGLKEIESAVNLIRWADSKHRRPPIHLGPFVCISSCARFWRGCDRCLPFKHSLFPHTPSTNSEVSAVFGVISYASVKTPRASSISVDLAVSGVLWPGVAAISHHFCGHAESRRSSALMS